MSYAEILRKGLQESSASAFAPNQQEAGARKSHKTGTTSSKKAEVADICHIDCGVNLLHRNLNTKIEKIIVDAVAYNCRKFIIIGHSIVDSRKAIAAVKKLNSEAKGNYKFYCTVGVQPHDAQRTAETTSEDGKTVTKNTAWCEELEDLIKNNLDIVVAVGKCGLDYDRMFSPKEIQMDVFEKQLQLAEKFSLPIFLHERFARDDFLRIFDRNTGNSSEDYSWKGVVHCFTGDKETAKKYIDRGFHLSITGRICDDSQNMDLLEAVKDFIPVDRILVATDAPYMTPKDLKKRPYYNGPQFIPHISAKIAYVKGIRKDELMETVWKNTQNLFTQFKV